MLRLLVADLLWVYELILIVRVAPDWAAQLAPAPAGLVRARARRFTPRLSEPVLVPIRRVLPPLRLGRFGLDLAFLVLLIGVQLLRAAVLHL